MGVQPALVNIQTPAGTIHQAADGTVRVQQPLLVLVAVAAIANHRLAMVIPTILNIEATLTLAFLIENGSSIPPLALGKSWASTFSMRMTSSALCPTFWPNYAGNTVTRLMRSKSRN